MRASPPPSPAVDGAVGDAPRSPLPAAPSPPSALPAVHASAPCACPPFLSSRPLALPTPGPLCRSPAFSRPFPRDPSSPPAPPASPCSPALLAVLESDWRVEDDVARAGGTRDGGAGGGEKGEERRGRRLALPASSPAPRPLRRRPRHPHPSAPQSGATAGESTTPPSVPSPSAASCASPCWSSSSPRFVSALRSRASSSVPSFSSSSSLSASPRPSSPILSAPSSRLSFPLALPPRELSSAPSSFPSLRPPARSASSWPLLRLLPSLRSSRAPLPLRSHPVSFPRPCSGPPPEHARRLTRPLDPRDPQVLKVLRYASRLALASSLFSGAKAAAGAEAGPRAAARDALRKLDRSIGEARKAYRVGKFLAGISELREILPSRPKHWVLKALVAGGDAAYYGVEQLVWLARIDVVPRRHLRRLDVVSNACGLVSYVAGMRLSHLKLAEIEGRKRALLLEAVWIQAGGGKGAGGEDEDAGEAVETISGVVEVENGEETIAIRGEIAEKAANETGSRASAFSAPALGSFPPSASLSPDALARLAEIERELAALSRAKKESALAFVQDFAETVMALATVRDDVQWLNADGLQALMGLVSGLVSTRKNWNKVVNRKK